MPQPLTHVESVRAGQDNIIWLIATAPDRFAAVDPGSAPEVEAFLARRNARLSHILITHHHGDHIGGVERLKRLFDPQVIGAAADAHRLPPLDRAVTDGERCPLDAAPEAEVLAVPGHTTGHVVYRVGEALFSGDTLFGFGCGRLFEGSPRQMWHSLQRLAALPDDTRLFAGHEYTLANLAFARHLEPDHAELAALHARFLALIDSGALSLPHPLGLEKRFNPFLRTHDAAFAARVAPQADSPVAVFAALREQRNRF